MRSLFLERKLKCFGNLSAAAVFALPILLTSFFGFGQTSLRQTPPIGRPWKMQWAVPEDTA